LDEFQNGFISLFPIELQSIIVLTGTLTVALGIAMDSGRKTFAIQYETLGLSTFASFSDLGNIRKVVWCKAWGPQWNQGDWDSLVKMSLEDGRCKDSGDYPTRFLVRLVVPPILVE
jgi:hypothetical protein